MNQQNIPLRDFVAHLDDADLRVVLLMAFCERRINELMNYLDQLSDGASKLQMFSCTLQPARACLFFTLFVHPTLEACLSYNARIVYSPLFESGVNRIQDHRVADLTTCKERAAKPFSSKDANAAKVDVSSDSMVERAFKRLRSSTTSGKSDYLNTHYLVLKSNLYERLFSISGVDLTNQR